MTFAFTQHTERESKSVALNTKGMNHNNGVRIRDVMVVVIELVAGPSSSTDLSSFIEDGKTGGSLPQLIQQALARSIGQ